MDRSGQTKARVAGGGGVLKRLREASRSVAEQLERDGLGGESVRRALVHACFIALADRRGLDRSSVDLAGPGPAADPLLEIVRDPRFEPTEDALGVVLEGATAAGQRRARGVHYTPAELARRLTEVAVAPLIRPEEPPKVCDPTAGSGAFLLAAARALMAGGVDREAAVAAMYGVELDPVAAETTRLALWLLGGGRTSLAGLRARVRVGDALVGRGRPHTGTAPARGGSDGSDLDVTGSEAMGEAELGTLTKPFHWPEAFPEIFARLTPGFDAVVGNPPFVNGIEAHGRRDDRTRQIHQRQWPVFCQGTYDACLAFWARALVDLLREGGRYGLVGPMVLMSDERPWKRWMQDRCRPEWIRTHPVDHFPGARVRTLAVAGVRAQPVEPHRTRFENLDPRVEAPPVSDRPLGPADTNWFSAMVGLDPGSAEVTLADLADVHAGCTAGDAYRLSEELVDAPAAAGPRLVTTGALDRYRCRWGERPIRFLRRDLRWPRWPAEPRDRGLRRALMRQRGPRILVGGLTSVLEAWCDEDGEAAGVVQTWVVRPRDARRIRWLVGLLNGAWLSRVLVARHGAEAMTGRQITVRKRALMALPMPRYSGGALDELLEEAVLQLCRGAGELDPAVDKTAHLVASVLFGRSPSDAEDDYRWWSDRTGASPCRSASPIRVLRRALQVSKS